MQINPSDIEEYLSNLLFDDVESSDGVSNAVVHIESFAEAGLLTDGAGLVLHADDGSKFQITIVRSGGGL